MYTYKPNKFRVKIISINISISNEVINSRITWENKENIRIIR